MKYSIHILLLITLILVMCLDASAQEKINQTDNNGNKQGYWVKKYPNGCLMYEGYFTDNKPVGEFKRYDEEGNLTSILNYTAEIDTVSACFYHTNGYLAGKGNYINQEKTGEWLYYSDYVRDHLLMKSNYLDNHLEGTRIKFHWNGKIAEELEFEHGVKSGEWKQYYTDGAKSLESKYIKGKRNGEFRTWYMNGKLEISGQYVKDIRTDLWYFYNPDGTLKREIKYNYGIPENNADLIREETDYLDKLEKEGGKIKDPEITGIIR